MNNKTCATCIDNDNGLCDRKGILIQEDDSCEKRREDWRQKLLSKFDKRERGIGGGQKNESQKNY